MAKINFLSKYTEPYYYILEDEKGKSSRIKSLKIINPVGFIEDVFKIDFKEVNTRSCVYMIGGVYIGSTGVLRARLLSHARSCINSKHYNKEFQKLFINNLINGISMPVEVLSLNKHEELMFIKKHSKKGKILNITGTKL